MKKSVCILLPSLGVAILAYLSYTYLPLGDIVANVITGVLIILLCLLLPTIVVGSLAYMLFSNFKSTGVGLQFDRSNGTSTLTFTGGKKAILEKARIAEWTDNLEYQDEGYYDDSYDDYDDDDDYEDVWV